MWWGAVAQGVEKMLEGTDFLVVQLQDVLEDPRLHGSVVDPHRPPTDLHAVKNEVIMLTTNLERVRLVKSRCG